MSTEGARRTDVKDSAAPSRRPRLSEGQRPLRPPGPCSVSSPSSTPAWGKRHAPTAGPVYGYSLFAFAFRDQKPGSLSFLGFPLTGTFSERFSLATPL